jgi:hypothetical protein
MPLREWKVKGKIGPSFHSKLKILDLKCCTDYQEKENSKEEDDYSGFQPFSGERSSEMKPGSTNETWTLKGLTA